MYKYSDCIFLHLQARILNYIYLEPKPSSSSDNLLLHSSQMDQATTWPAPFHNVLFGLDNGQLLQCLRKSTNCPGKSNNPCCSESVPTYSSNLKWNYRWSTDLDLSWCVLGDSVSCGLLLFTLSSVFNPPQASQMNAQTLNGAIGFQTTLDR